MSEIIYHLSNRQRRLLERDRTAITIALPVPLHSLARAADLDAWVSRVLEPSIRELVSKSWIQHVHVDPLAVDDGDILRSAIGRIVHPRDLDIPTFLLTIKVVVVTLLPPRKRGQKTDIQWPGRCEFMGEAWPPPIEEA